MGLRASARFQLVIRTTKLWIAPYSEYQEFLFQTISNLRARNHSFQEIADWMNERGYKTPRGNLFRNAHAHSILKRKLIRDERLNRACNSDILSFDVMIDAKM
jgi:hypothetical protein